MVLERQRPVRGPRGGMGPCVPRTPLVRALMAAGLVLSSAQSSALGLGEMEVSSLLGRPFRATIAVRLTAEEAARIRGLTVDVPSYREQTGLGLAEPIVPEDLQPALITGPDGSRAIRLRSRHPLNEPVLDFLVRVRWSEGQIVREYAVLLDPPLYARPGEPAPAPVPPARTARAPAAVPTPAQPAAAAPAAPPPEAGGQRRYGPVRRGETLSAIALEHYPGQRGHLEALVQILFERNREAFLHDDPGLLMAGSTLTLPAPDTVARAVAARGSGIGRRVAAARPAAQRHPVQPALPPRYGPVRPNETLSGITRRLAGGDDARVDALMERIFEDNPEAFIDGDRDLLRQGVTLTLPPASERTARSAGPEAEPTPRSVQGPHGAAASAPPAVPAPDADAPRQQDLEAAIAAVHAELERVRERQRELKERYARVEEHLQSLWLMLDDAKTYRGKGRAAEQPPAPGMDYNTLAPEPAPDVDGRARAPAGTHTETSAFGDSGAAGAFGTSPSAASEPEAAPAPAEPPASDVADGLTYSSPSTSRTTAPPPVPTALGRDAYSGLRELLWELPRQVAMVFSVWLVLVLVLRWRRRRALSPEEDLFERRRDQAQQAKQRLAELRQRYDHGYRRNDQTRTDPKARRPASQHQHIDRWGAKRLAQEAAVYFSYGEHERAMQSIEEAIRLEPDWDGNKVLKLRIQEALGLHDEAEALARELMKRAQHLPEELRGYIDEISRGKHRAA
jgi:pilus assembly protein FimV